MARAAAWGLGLAAALGVLLGALDLALGRAATGVAMSAAGLALIAASLARLAPRESIRVSSGPRAPAPP